MAIKVLIVDDEPSNVYAIEQFLTYRDEEKYEIVTAQSLASATTLLDLPAIPLPDVILLDLTLKGESYGLDTLKIVLNLVPTVAIIIYTGITEGEIQMEAIKLGAQGCVIKGKIDEEDLHDKIQIAVEKQKERNNANTLIEELKRTSRSIKCSTNDIRKCTESLTKGITGSVKDETGRT